MFQRMERLRLRWHSSTNLAFHRWEQLPLQMDRMNYRAQKENPAFQWQKPQVRSAWVEQKELAISANQECLPEQYLGLVLHQKWMRVVLVHSLDPTRHHAKSLGDRLLPWVEKQAWTRFEALLPRSRATNLVVRSQKLLRFQVV